MIRIFVIEERRNRFDETTLSDFTGFGSWRAYQCIEYNDVQRGSANHDGSI